MNTKLLINTIVENENGYLRRDLALASGVSDSRYKTYIKNNNLKRLAAGVYADEDVWADELYLLSVKNARAVFSHETALYLHGLSDREPRAKTVTVPHGYNASHLKRKGVKVVSAIDRFANLGISEAKTPFGNPVKVYDMERTVCDIIKNKEKMDIQVFQTALKEFMARSDKRISVLMFYARELGIENKVRMYTEVLL